MNYFLRSFLTVSTAWFSLFAGEGMFPVTTVGKLNLAAKGLKLSPEQVFSMDSVSLAHTVVRLNGCTGSFVSDQGLILTNYHCAFSAVQAATSVQNDYMKNGFLAKSLGEEFPVRGQTALILEIVRDVSTEALKLTTTDMDPQARQKTIQTNTKTILENAKKEMPGKQIEISEMLTGISYYLFVFQSLRDVRLVYAPPRSIGKFGGEDDNWAWPRHTGDFAFLRAYVSPDGNSAEYNTANIPYHPKKHLAINYQGVQENDFIMILGYPGRTFRHRSASFLAYEQKRMPMITDIFDFEIDLLNKIGAKDRGRAIKLSDRIENWSNVTKNYKGKLKGFRALDIIDKKHDEEERLAEFISADTSRRLRYGNILKDIESIYDARSLDLAREIPFDRMYTSVILNRIATVILDAAAQMRDKPTEQSAIAAKVYEAIEADLKKYDAEADQAVCRELFSRMMRLPREKSITGLDKLINPGQLPASLDKVVSKLFSKSKLSDSLFVKALLNKPADKILTDNDIFLELARTLLTTRDQVRATRSKADAELNRLYALLTEVRREFLKKDFVPDANFTMRVTYGTIKGYAPADAIYYKPQTTFSGVVEKTKSGEFWETPPKLIALWKGGLLGRYRLPNTNDVPVAMLYDPDTTGGNSGSPVVNAYGQLIGLNFDRTFEATINDFAWDERYSRSIGVDVRYILWVMQYFSEAKNLLSEMKIPTD